jgi:NAD(P)-dependent dehydrogenase (short-subunit alcohol dehydrogenase family)
MINTNLFSLKNKVIVVTGGTGILGNVFVKSIADAGGIVGILGRNTAIAEVRANAILNAGGEAIALTADVTKKLELEKACELILNRYGRIDGLVNAAGGNMPEAIVQPSEDIFNLNLDGLKDVMNLNLWGTVLPTQVFGKVLAKSESASIVNISSMASQRAITKILGYGMSKAAIDNYTKWFALELANRYHDKIRINAIAPGFFLTEQNRTLLTNTDGSTTERGAKVMNQTPYKRFGNPDELAGTLVWLLSDASKFVNGTVVNVDGGFMINSGV